MISLCTFVKNEAHCIAYMFASVLKHVDEIVVVDTGSTDGTVEICRRYTPRVYQVEFSNFGSLRTITAHLATQPWVLMLDADETLDRPGVLKNLAQDEAVQAYAFPRKRWLDLKMEHQTEAKAYPDYQVRFFRNNKDYVWRRELHEYFDGAEVKELPDTESPIINHFQDVFKDEDRRRTRKLLYQRLAKQAGVHVHGGLPITPE